MDFISLNRSIVSVFALVVALSAPAAGIDLRIVSSHRRIVAADAAHEASQSRPTSRPKKKITYAVVRVGEDLRIVPVDGVKNLKKKVAREYKNRVADYKAARAAARKKKEKFDKPMPKKVSVKVLRSSFKTRRSAVVYIDDLRKKEKKKKATSRPTRRKQGGW